MKRLFGVLCAAAFLAAVTPVVGAQEAATPVPAPSQPPLCAKNLSVMLGAVTTVGGMQRAVAVVSQPATAPCLVAAFPTLARPNAKAPLHAARLSLQSSATVAAGSPVSFVVRYVAGSRGSSQDCTLMAFANDTAKLGSLRLPSCEPLAEIAVSSYAPGPAAQLDMPAVAPTPPGERSIPRCRANDLVVRDVGADQSGSTARETIAVQNRGTSRCLLFVNERIALFDAAGQPFAYSGPQTNPPTAAGALSLQPGYEASLTLAFATPAGGTKHCPPLRSFVLALPDGNVTAVASDSLAPCPAASGPVLQTSPLRLGIPLGS